MKCNISFPVEKKYIQIEPSNHYHTSLTPVMSYSYSCVQAYSQNREVIKNNTLHYNLKNVNIFPDNRFHISGERDCPINSPFYFKRTMNTYETADALAKEISSTGNLKTTDHEHNKDTDSTSNKKYGFVILNWIKSHLKYVKPFFICSSPSNPSIGRQFFDRKKGTQAQVLLDYNINSSVKNEILKFVRDLNLKAEEIKSLNEDKTIQIDVTPLMNNPKYLQKLVNAIKIIENKINMSKHELNNYHDSVSNDYNLNEIEEGNAIHLKTKLGNKLNQSTIKNINSDLHRPLSQRNISKFNKSEVDKRNDKCLYTGNNSFKDVYDHRQNNIGNPSIRNINFQTRNKFQIKKTNSEHLHSFGEPVVFQKQLTTVFPINNRPNNSAMLPQSKEFVNKININSVSKELLFGGSNSDLAAPITTNMGLNHKYCTQNKFDNINVNEKQRKVSCNFEPCTMQAENDLFNITKENDYNKNALKEELRLVLNNTGAKKSNKQYYNNLQENIDNQNNQELINNIILPQFIVPECSYMVKPNVQHTNTMQNISNNNQMLKNSILNGNMTNNIVQISLENEKPITYNNHDIQEGTVNNVLSNIFKGPSIVKACKSVRNVKGNITQKPIITNEQCHVSELHNHTYKAIISKNHVNRFQHISENKGKLNMDLRNVSKSPQDSIVHFASEQGDNIECNINKQLLNYTNDKTITSSIDTGIGLVGNGDSAKTVDKQNLSKEINSQLFNSNNYVVDFIDNIRGNECNNNNKHCHEYIEQPYNNTDCRHDLNSNSKFLIKDRNRILYLPVEKRKTNYSENVGSGCTVQKIMKNNNDGKQKTNSQLKRSNKLFNENVQQIKTNIKTNIVNKHNMLEEHLNSKLSTEVNEIFVTSSTMPCSSSSHSYKNKSHNKTHNKRSKVRKQTTFINTFKNNSKITYFPKSNKSIISIKSKLNKFSNILRKNAKKTLTINPAENENVKHIIPSYTVNRITKITSLPKMPESGRIKSSQKTNLPRTSKRIIVQCSASKPTGDVSTLFRDFNRCSTNDKYNSIDKITSLKKPKGTESKDNIKCSKHPNTDNNMNSSQTILENMNFMDITPHRSVHHYTGPGKIHANKDSNCYKKENCKKVSNFKNMDSGNDNIFCHGSFVYDMGNFITDNLTNKQESCQYSKQNKIKSEENLNCNCVCLDSLTYGTNMINTNILNNEQDNFKQPESRTEHILAKKPKYNHICHDTQMYSRHKLIENNSYNKRELYYKQNEMKTKSYIKTNYHNVCNDTLTYNGRKINEHLPHYDEKEYHIHNQSKKKSEDMLHSNCFCHSSLTYNKRARNPIHLHNERKYPTVTKSETKLQDSNSRNIWSDMLIYKSKNKNYNLPNSGNQFRIHGHSKKNVEDISNFYNFYSDTMIYNNLNQNQNLSHNQSESKNKSHRKLNDQNICHNSLTYNKIKLNHQNICHDTLTYNKDKLNHQNVHQDKLTTNKEKLMNALQPNANGFESCRQNENKSQSLSNYNYFCHNMLTFNNEKINDNLLHNEGEHGDICEMKPRSQNKPDNKKICHDTLTYNNKNVNNSLQHNERGCCNYGQSENKLLGLSNYNYFCHDMQTFNNEKISHNFQHNSREHSDICENKSRFQDNIDYQNICCHTLNYNKRKCNENLQSDKGYFISSEGKTKTQKKLNCECMFHDSLICDMKKQNCHEYKTINSESKFIQSLQKDRNTCVTTICYPSTCSLHSKLEKQSKISVNGNAISTIQNYLDPSQGECKGGGKKAQFVYNAKKEHVFHTKTRENNTEQIEKVQNKSIDANSLFNLDKHNGTKSSKLKQRHLIYSASNSPKSNVRDGNLWEQHNWEYTMNLSDEGKLYTANDPSIAKFKTLVKNNQSNVDILTSDVMPVSDLKKRTICSKINHDARCLREPILEIEEEQNENRTLNMCFDSLYYKSPILNPGQNVNDSETLLSSNNSRNNDTTTTYSPGTSTTNQNIPLEYDIVLHSESHSGSSSSGLIFGDSSSGINTPIKLLLKMCNNCDFFENLNEYSENNNSEGGQYFNKSNCKQLRNNNNLNTSCVDIGQGNHRTLSGRGNSQFMGFKLHKCAVSSDNNQSQCRHAKSNKRNTGIVINNNNVKPNFKQENKNQPLSYGNICSNLKEVQKQVDNIVKYEKKALLREQPINKNKIIRVERHPNYIYAHERTNIDESLKSEKNQKKDSKPNFNPKVLFTETPSLDKFKKGSKESSYIYVCDNKTASLKNTKININQDFHNENRNYIQNDSTAIISNIRDNKSCDKLNHSNSISLLIPKTIGKLIGKWKNFHKSNNLKINDSFSHNVIENLKRELHFQQREISDIKKDFIKVCQVLSEKNNDR